MTKTIILTLLIAGIFTVGSIATNEASAAGFLKIGDIKGESTDAEHEDEIDILSWSWGETNSGSHTGGGGGAGKVSMQDFHFVMEYNKASPKIMESLANGQHFDDASLILTRVDSSTGGQQEYLKITMETVLISSYQTGGSTGETDIPVEEVSLNFGAIKFEYTPQSDVGSPETVTGSASKHGRK